MFKKILIGLAVAVVVFLIVAALQPPLYIVTRNISINAPAADLFPRVNDLHKFQEWNPWDKIDPNVKNTFTGPDSGIGASMAWAGNAKVGEGSMTIVESVPNERIMMRLDFLKPFPSTADAEFMFKTEGDGTVVSWTMTGKKNFVSKAMGLVMSMDKMIGSEFERGLSNLKALAEKKV